MSPSIKSQLRDTELDTKPNIEVLSQETAKNGISADDLPEILAGKSPEELITLRKGLVRKIDNRLMPMLVVLFLLK
jgi:hypothetical protein